MTTSNVVDRATRSSGAVAGRGHGNSTVLSLTEWRVTDDPAAQLSCLGLGSCVALCVYHSGASVAGMAHIVLPDSTMSSRPPTGAKFADVAVPMVIEEMERLGAKRSQMECYLVGGAKILRNSDVGPLSNIGDRNIEAAEDALRAMGLRPKGCDVGGEHGRTVRLDVSSGHLQVQTAGDAPTVLRLGQAVRGTADRRE